MKRFEMPYRPVNLMNRRHFLYASGLTLASSALSAKKIVGANETIRLGLIGCGRRSEGLLKQFLKIPNVEVVAVCDPQGTKRATRRMGH